MSPLTKDYCYYFYLLGILSFVMLIVGLVTGIMKVLTEKKLLVGLAHLVMMSLGPLIAYYVNRLLYTMCVNSVN
tara:strand:- start:4208 stop:4429 length:222 start_codon:yes stop_codon:yes gene_type:complete